MYSPAGPEVPSRGQSALSNDLAGVGTHALQNKNLCGLSALRDGNDHVALLVTQVDVAMRIHNLIQRVATVDHRPKRAALGEFLQHQ